MLVLLSSTSVPACLLMNTAFRNVLDQARCNMKQIDSSMDTCRKWAVLCCFHTLTWISGSHIFSFICSDVYSHIHSACLDFGIRWPYSQTAHAHICIHTFLSQQTCRLERPIKHSIWYQVAIVYSRLVGRWSSFDMLPCNISGEVQPPTHREYTLGSQPWQAYA